MKSSFVEELRWRGLIQDIMPDTEKHLAENTVSAYIGFDPTADTLHIGSLVPIILLMHFKNHGHKPIALVGGATGMIGDPSGKSAERNLLTEEILNKNVNGIKSVLSRFLNFNGSDKNTPELVNNYDWMKDFSFIDFARDIGKHITVNYMMAKDSVKKRLSGESSEGMSFTEFTYQLIQGFDFLWLYENKGITLQMGGSDQWGNITTGTELIRRKAGGKAYAITCPLITKADGSKFGKTEGGNVWLDANRTSPYKFYQYWLNTSDEDAIKYIKIFTFLDQETVNDLINEHWQNPGLRSLQKRLAQEVTTLIHGDEAYDQALMASSLLFGKSTAQQIKALDETTLLDVFEGVPQQIISEEKLTTGMDMIQTLADTGFLKSNSEAMRALKENSISINKEKVAKNYVVTKEDLIAGRYILLQRGKKKLLLINDCLII